jgi:ABC-2 type transport system ATP-binding protein
MVVQVENLCVAGKLNGVSLSVAAGEVVAVVGSRGAGKSTLVRVLAGQQAATSGRVTVAGERPGAPGYLRAVGVVGDAWGFYERMTVADNLAFYAVAWGVPQARVEELLKRLELSAVAGRRVEKLLAGELARLRLVRALLHDPSALLLDEPVGDIDRESASLIAFAIGEEAERGKAVLMTTFGYRYATDGVTRVCYLEEGRLLEPEPVEASVGVADAVAAAAAVAPASGAVPVAAVPATEAPGHSPLKHIAARRDERLLLFRPEEIRYAYAQEKSVYIQTAEGPFAVSLSLSDLEERLAGEGFFRCHRAYLVNMAWVKELASWTRDSYSLILKDGKDVPLSKHRTQELRLRLSL